MRVLFTSWAWPSHLYAQVPLALACRAAGHEVVFAGQPGLTGDILRAGLPAAVVGTDIDTVGMVREYLLPATDAGETRAPGAGGGKGPRALRMLLAHAESMAADLARLAREWRADLLVYDQTALAGPLAAAVAGIPSVRHLYGTDLLLRARTLLPEALAPLADRLGAGTFDPFGAATVDPVPPSLQAPGDVLRFPMRHLPYNGPQTVPWWPAARTEPARSSDHRVRGRVCVSWGHTIARLDSSRFLAGRIASAIAELDVEVSLAVSAAQRPLLGPMPPNVRIVVDVPLWQVLPGCDVFVGHGGASSILTALGHGLPMLLVPQLPDHWGHSLRVTTRGVGTVLDPGELTAAVVRERVAELLGDANRQEQRSAAREVHEEMLGQPSPTDVARALAELRSDGRTTGDVPGRSARIRPGRRTR